MLEFETLKKDLFGEVRQMSARDGTRIVRYTGSAKPWLRCLARYLLRREAAALAALDGMRGTPELLHAERDRLERTYIPGKPMHKAKPRDADYFRAASGLLRRLHRNGVVHNDLAKEPNLLVTADGQPAFIDFQLAWYSRNRGRLFRTLAYEDIRHLLKHKRSYCPQELTHRERGILDNPSLPSRLWRNTVKPVYHLITRRLLGWADREGAGDRGETQ